MMKKNIVLMLLVFILALSVAALAGCGQEPAAPSPAPTEEPAEGPAEEPAVGDEIDMEYTEWSLACYLDSSSYHYKQQVDMCDAIRERTNGLLDIVVYGAGELPFTGYEFVQITSDRTVEMSTPGFGYFEGESPVSGVPSYPMLVDSNEEMIIAVDAIKPYIEEELGSYGVEVLALWSTMGMVFFGMGDAPESWEDLAGEKVRVHDPRLYEIMTPYGIEPVSMTWADVIPSMQRGVIDCAMTAAPSAYDAGWQEVVDYAFRFNVMGSGSYTLVNSEAFAELPENVQQIVREEALNYQATSIAYNEDNSEVAWQGFGDAGVVLVDAPESDKEKVTALAVEVWDKLAASSGGNCAAALADVREALGK